MRNSDLIRTGAVAGCVGALAMSAWFFAARLLLGIPTPSEMFADLSAPYIPVHLFGILIGLVHGYTPLKILGFSSVVFGQIVVGAIGGYFGARDGRPKRFLALFSIVAWVVTGAFFAAVLLGNYRGANARLATVLTLVSLALGFVVYGLVTARLLSALEAAARPSRGRSAPTRATWIAGALVTAATAIGWGRLFARSSFSYDGRMDIGPDVAALTPNERFYSVTKNVADPSVDASLWSLSVEGAVDNPVKFDLAALQALKYVEQETTLMCINNEPGGGLMSNALWRGVTFPSLIAAAKPQAGVVRAILHAGDNYADTIPFEKAMDATTVVAYLMNGVPLPPKHGFPARAIVPGWFGEKNVKWLRSIELSTEPVKGFYERQGWGPNFHVPTHSRFDFPDFMQPLPRGAAIDLRGVAFCGDRGVARVEVSDDDGHTWRAATFTSHYERLAWRLWRYAWRPAARGTYRLAVRAWDANGLVQPGTDRPSETEGATGYHRVTARVV